MTRSDDHTTAAAARTARGEAFDILRTVGAALLLATAFRILAWQPFTIPSSSMEPGLVTGDYIVVSKFAYGWSGASLPFGPWPGGERLFGRGPDRGEVVVFRDSRQRGKTLIKRVIGVPGDRVQVRDGAVLVNGAAIARQAIGPRTDRDDPNLTPMVVVETAADGRRWETFDRGVGPGDDTEVFVVPEGRYFMMGDNRDNSLDSRWPAGVGVGFVDEADIVGRADLILASWDKGTSLLKPWTWLTLNPGRVLKPVR
ncbi:MAG: signal peptidase I [Caulobacter sp.]